MLCYHFVHMLGYLFQIFYRFYNENIDFEFRQLVLQAKTLSTLWLMNLTLPNIDCKSESRRPESPKKPTSCSSNNLYRGIRWIGVIRYDCKVLFSFSSFALISDRSIRF